jgi:hypothetical protein
MERSSFSIKWRRIRQDVSRLRRIIN